MHCLDTVQTIRLLHAFLMTYSALISNTKLLTFPKLFELHFGLLGPVPEVGENQLRRQSIPSPHAKGLDATIACAIATKALTNTAG